MKCMRVKTIYHQWILWLIISSSLLFIVHCGAPLAPDPVDDDCWGWGDRFTNGDVRLTVFSSADTVVAVGEKLGSPDPWETITFGGYLTAVGRARGRYRVARQYEDGTYIYGEDSDAYLNLPNDGSCDSRNTLTFEINYPWGEGSRGPENYELTRE